MILKTEKKVEYRLKKVVEGKNGNYYLYTFESDDNSLVFYSKEIYKLEKGKMYDLRFSVTVFNNKNQFNLIDVVM